MAAQSNELVKSYTTEEKTIFFASLGLIAVGLLTTHFGISGVGLAILGVSEVRRMNRVADDAVNALAKHIGNSFKPPIN